jgi:hypothetical protein
MQYKEQFGYVTIAQNTDECDYVRMAYLQALSIKLSMPGSRYAVITNDTVPDEYLEVFDYVIPLVNPNSWAQANEWQVFGLTPFKETIKLEADLVFTRDCSHWLDLMRLKEVVLSTHCKDIFGHTVKKSAHRKLFTDNNLPDVYNGLMYFRYSQIATNFFKTAEMLFANWEAVKQSLKGCDDELPTTDVIYAVTALLVGVENVTIASTNFINFVHLKNTINKWPESDSWPNMVLTEINAPMVRINNLNQYYPVHYHDKEWINDDIIGQYRSAFRTASRV